MPNREFWSAMAQSLPKAGSNFASAYREAREAAKERQKRAEKEMAAEQAKQAQMISGQQLGLPEAHGLYQQQYSAPDWKSLGFNFFPDGAAPEAEPINEVAMPEGLKLKPGEAWNPTIGRVEAVPGTDLYQQQTARAAKAAKAAEFSKTKIEGAIKQIDDIKSDKKLIENQFGSLGTGFVTGFIDPSGRAKINNLRANFQALGLELMKNGGGIGQVTEREWPKMESLLAQLTPGLDEKTALEFLDTAREKLSSILNDGQKIELARKIMNDPMAEADDVTWAQNILGIYSAR